MTTQTIVKTSPERPRERARATVARSWLPTLAVAVLAAAVFLLSRKALIDDAYITLAYARNLAFHLHWGLVPTLTANTATSPLNELLLGLLTSVTRAPVLALGVVYVLSAVAMEYGLRRAARSTGLPGWIGLLTVLFTALNPLLISSIGLEISLGGGLVALLFAASLARRPLWFGVIAGMLALTRPDLLIIVVVVFLARPKPWRRWWLSLIGLLVVTVPWYLWSWTALGSALPDTLLLKVNQGAWAGHKFDTGPVLYHDAFPTAALLSYLPAAIGALLAVCWLVLRLVRHAEPLRRLDRFFALPLAGGLHYLAYSILGVPPYHWYYGTSIICCSAFVAVVIGAIARTSESTLAARMPGLAGGVLTAALVVVSAVDFSADGLPRQAAQITTNWATSRQYEEIGTAVGRLAGDQVVSTAAEIGAIAYFCDCTVVDPFSDQGYIVQKVSRWLDAMQPLNRKVMGWNFHYLDRSHRPLVATLALVYTTEPPSGALGTWQVNSPWMDPPGHWHYLSLVPAG
ncbi:hypothetical protein [Amycolatopsis sp. SID8362]|uniref:hypothetical protein n=1 Tax=Amycolatopsis sp. SID8362 TaxID=2690346 RepID=UPI0013719A43|nr:hypothetical protein [Amycolatopsis sp. SID8362]NBH11799.1 hypothetical protein [Amycolatopsis sp. SID8362]NED48491.1 hypothetical protein [Amycolatopsis sp. SID8362]